ncbi:MAG: hypothetical protein JW795_22410 [Chitinivibrionales bacterium]|nr:hypothetical protein [Chitinivibrionales bacterium]
MIRVKTVLSLCAISTFCVMHIIFTGEAAENKLPTASDKAAADTKSDRTDRRSSDTISLEKLRQSAMELQHEANLLNEQARDIIAEIKRLEVDQKPESIPNGSNGCLDQQITQQALALRDTIQILTKETAKSFLESFTSKKRSARQRGYGGCLGPSINFALINTQPLQELVASDPELRGLGFSIPSYKPFLFMGGFIYGGVGNGVRIGFTGRTASTSSAVTRNDTNFTLATDISYSGFLIEKSVVRQDMNYLLGGVIGSGNISTMLLYGMGAFNKVHHLGQTDAQFLNMEFHAGFTYSIAGWFHIGPIVSMPLFFSAKGFKNEAQISRTGGFMTLNPSVQVRIVFGNIG